MSKRVVFLFVMLIVNMVCSGCWNYREIDTLSIVAGVAIDKSEKGKYTVTTEIVDMHEGGREAKIRSKTLEAYGDTLFDAIRNTTKITASRLYWGHVEIAIISQEVAKEGVIEIIDFLDRDAEPRLNVDLLISKEKTAKEILNSQSITTEIRSYEINKMLATQRGLSKAPKTEVYQFINTLSDEGISAVIPTVGLYTNEGEKTSEISGTAVFKQDKLVGLLNEEETKAFLFVMNRIKGGILMLKKNPEDENEYPNISLEIIENKTKVKPVCSNGKVSYDIEIKTRTSLSEYGAKKNFIDENRNSTLEKDSEEMLNADVKNIIHKVQEDFDTDIFGFGKNFREKLPLLWKEIEPDWDRIFRNIDVNVSSSIEIDNSGLLSKPIKVGD